MLASPSRVLGGPSARGLPGSCSSDRNSLGTTQGAAAEALRVDDAPTRLDIAITELAAMTGTSGSTASLAPLSPTLFSRCSPMLEAHPDCE